MLFLLTSVSSLSVNPQVFEIIYPLTEGPKVLKGMQENYRMMTSDWLIIVHAWRCHFSQASRLSVIFRLYGIQMNIV